MSDVVNLLEDFCGEPNIERGSVVDAELLSVKEDKNKLEKSFAEMESRATELAKANLAFLTHVFFNFIYLPHPFLFFIDIYMITGIYYEGE